MQPAWQSPQPWVYVTTQVAPLPGSPLHFKVLRCADQAAVQENKVIKRRSGSEHRLMGLRRGVDRQRDAPFTMGLNWEGAGEDQHNRNQRSKPTNSSISHAAPRLIDLAKCSPSS